ncbi:MAG: zf-HC2 domain-containing protein [Acidobacteriota bacterium]
MHCQKVLELLPRFIENDFSEEEAEQIRKHLEECESCRAEYEAMARLVDSLEDYPLVNVPASFKDAIMRSLPKKTPGGEGPQQ